ncbi:MAG: TnsA endonuclease N-terminal domain-containing protein [Polynucleobacter sp.]
MPVRKIPKNYRNVTGVHASEKSIGEAQFESTLERDFLTLLEFHPDVERFEVQPKVIHWEDSSGKQRKHTPDVLVLFKPDLKIKPWLCEVKYRSDIFENWPQYKPKFKAGIRHAKAAGWRYRLITEIEVRTPFLANCRFLTGFKFQKPKEQDIKLLLERIKHLGQSTPAALLAAIDPDKYAQAYLMPTLWHLIANHRIDVDLYQDLTMQSIIWSKS